MKHYLQVTDEHFERAIREPESALQNPVQHSAETARNESQPLPTAQQKTPVFPGLSVSYDIMNICTAPR
ncbi:MAG: hypothetical protein JSS27_03355 [Planctomycetes bacterium]|nr:hypothetical protein [Planctomycetota bacterium]